MIFCWKWMPMLTPLAAHRNASFWQISVPPTVSSFSGTIAPGVGEAKATRALPDPLWVKTVVNSDSPVTSRLPAPSSLPMKPPPWSPDPSPNTVVMPTPASFHTSDPASATALSPGSSLDLDELQFLALDLEIDVVGQAGCRAMGPGAGGGHGRGSSACVA